MSIQNEKDIRNIKLSLMFIVALLDTKGLLSAAEQKTAVKHTVALIGANGITDENKEQIKKTGVDFDKIVAELKTEGRL